MTLTKKSDSEINEKRSKLLVPGSQLELDKEEARVPVIFVQQSASKSFGAGWDVILPAGWGEEILYNS